MTMLTSLDTVQKDVGVNQMDHNMIPLRTAHPRDNRLRSAPRPSVSHANA